LEYQVEWLVETIDEMKAFPKDFQKTIKHKVEHIAISIPISLKLKSIQPIRDQEQISVRGDLYELDIGSGPRVAFCVDDENKIVTVFMVGTHDYAYSNYLKLASKRLPKLK
jgi:mRNA-degrading endonuclease RelE of RelBE toxin-antitoxin system